MLEMRGFGDSIIPVGSTLTIGIITIAAHDWNNRTSNEILYCLLRSSFDGEPVSACVLVSLCRLHQTLPDFQVIEFLATEKRTSQLSKYMWTTIHLYILFCRNRALLLCAWCVQMAVVVREE